VRPSAELIVAIAVLLGVAAACAPAWADEMLYYVEGDRVVFTNTPSRVDVKTVPGFAERVRLARANLPATPYDGFIEQLGRMDGLDPDLIKAVAMVESGFDPAAVSPKGAMGLMQLMPSTAAQYDVQDPLDPYESLRAGSRHLRGLLDNFDGDLTLALAAYNAGAGAVRRHGGVTAYRETRDYVRKVHSKLKGEGTVRPASSPPDDPNIVVRVDDDGSVHMTN
jgi:soluble lytic murein transglycosylase-like protein